ncbi:TrkH family potassium uptake protein [Tsukamurella tyrosinosolvens]|uniref:TrkH family potassium uptake protein n=1 Tax=Tsukamurella tyrosinosolvens TaxID=57704 RepID=UPI000792684D|nr:potassium transporter TrkG [Tsukamurella tyrosinosolvens]AUN41065.1 ATPase [Tsukamurella tyrosinosolvens]KXP04398.1 ATPase [Tsukamurella tyrosinosolvens]KZL97637.1 ATPase [Tsukamurella tyrosinosolvens]MCA4995759.1 TrkH family potassium uptake protein [Tsukamurella tyrosinosolvens]
MARGMAGPTQPARLIVLGFGLATVLGTVLLSLPIAATDGQRTALSTALFTATSAVCVNGLAVVDTESHWSTFGEVVIMVLVQVGGLGIISLASLLGLLVARRIGLRLQILAQAENKSLELGESKRVVLGVVRMSLAVEAVTALFLFARFALGYDVSLGRAAYLAVFHAVTAYNNAGIALYSDSLTRFAEDPGIVVPIMVAIVIGGLGFPVIYEVTRAMRRRLNRDTALTRWSLHTKLTLVTYFALLVAGVALITAFEWSNPATLGPRDVPGKILTGMFAGVSPRTAGFNTIDVGAMHPTSLLTTDVLMFIGGGSGGVAGGIKVTTFAILAFVIWAEVRGEPTVHAFGRRISADVQRQAITVALMSVGAVMVGTLTLLQMTHFELDAVLFEVVSAFSTVGLSTGITDDLPLGGRILLVVLMFAGRLGPVTVASALALRERERRYELPEERPIVG